MVLVDTEAGTGNAFEAFDDRATGVVLKTNVKFGLAFVGNDGVAVDVTFILEDLGDGDLQDGITTSAFSTI